jgi:hypothetical protein
MIDSKTKQMYLVKANDSFTTKLNLFLFSWAIKQDSEIPNIENFRNFEISSDLVELYTTEYWQYEPDYPIKGISCDDIYKQIDKVKNEQKGLFAEFKIDYLKNQFPEIFPISEFDDLLKNNECAYCQITTEEIVNLANAKQLHKKNYRGWSLEIDRKDSNLEYKISNCVMACYWCNNAKTDEFTFDEFKEIGKEIRKVWEVRLGRNLGMSLEK